MGTREAAAIDLVENSTPLPSAGKQDWTECTASILGWRQVTESPSLHWPQSHLPPGSVCLILGKEGRKVSRLQPVDVEGHTDSECWLHLTARYPCPHGEGSRSRVSARLGATHDRARRNQHPRAYRQATAVSAGAELLWQFCS